MQDVDFLIFDSSSHVLLSGVSSKLYLDDVEVSTSVSDSTGYIVFHDVIIDIYSVLFSKVGFVEKIIDLDLNSKEVTWQVEMNPLLYRVSGSVQYQSKEISDVIIAVKSTGVTTTSDFSGYFEFDNIHYDVLVFIFDHHLYETEEVELFVTQNGSLGVFDLVPSEFHGVITIFDRQADVPIGDPFVSNHRGIVTLESLHGGVYSIEAERSGFYSYSSTVEVTDHVLLDIALDPVFFTISGLVSYLSAPIEEVSVVIDGTVSSTLTNSQGYFEFNQVRYGNITLIIEDSHYESVIVELEVSTDNDLDISLNSKPFSVEVNVFDSKSMKLLEGASVTLEQSGDVIGLTSDDRGVVLLMTSHLVHIML
ncbi:hypothetical protein GEMRC1_013973 [Eukaryota sp. GEM-RC1]